MCLRLQNFEDSTPVFKPGSTSLHSVFKPGSTTPSFQTRIHNPQFSNQDPQPPVFKPGSTTPSFQTRIHNPQFSNQDPHPPVFKPGSTTSSYQTRLTPLTSHKEVIIFLDC